MDYLEQLKKLISPTEYDKVVKDLGDKHLIINDGSYIPRSTFNEKTSEIVNLTKQVDTLTKGIAANDAKLKEFGKLETTNTELKDSLKTLETTNSTLVTDSKAALQTATDEATKVLNTAVISGEVKVALIAQGATSEVSRNSILANLDMSKVSFSDNKLSGLMEQVTPLKETSPSLFFADKVEKTQESTTKFVGTEYTKGKNPTDTGATSEEKIQGMYKEEV